MPPLFRASILVLFFAAAGLEADLMEDAWHVELPNGLEVILIPYGANPVVAVTAVVRAGVRDEAAGQHGASHFLEHLLFNGTEGRTQKQLYDEADFLGIYNNAATREDHTVFMMLAGREHLGRALNLQADMLFHSTLPPESFEKERKIVLEEIARDAHGADFNADQFHRSVVFRDTPYARSVLGTPESLGRLARDEVWAYYRRHYSPGNMTLMVMGDFDAEEVLDAVRKEYGGVPRREKPAENAAGSISWNGCRMWLKREPSFHRHTLDVSMPGPRPGQPDYPGAVALVRVLNDRLAARYGHGRVEGVQEVSLTVEFNRDFGRIRLSALLDEKSDALALAQQMLADLRQPGSYRAKAGDMEGLLNDLAAKETFLSEKVHYFTFEKAGALAAGSLHFLKGYVKSLEAVTPEHLIELGERYLAQAPFRATVIGPGVETRENAEFPLDAPGRALASPDRVRAPRLVRQVLPGGLTVLVQSNPGSNLCAAHLLARNRSASESPACSGIADFLHRALLRGTHHRTAEAIARDISEMGGTIKVTDDRFLPFDDYYFSPEYSYVRLETLARHLDRGVWLLADLVRYPALDPKEMERLKEKILAEVDEGAGGPKKAAREVLLRKLLGDHPFARPLSGDAKSISSISGKDLARFHARYFSPSNLILSVVADRIPETVMPVIRQAFEGFTGGSASEAAGVWKGRESKGVTFLPDAGLPQAQIALGHRVSVAEAERPVAALVEALLSDRLAFQLREREGLAYSLGCAFTLTPSGGIFMAEMGTRPANVDQALAGLQREIRGFRSAKVAAGDLDRVRNTLISRRRMRRLTSMNQAFFLGLQEARGQPADFEEQWTRALRDVRVDQVDEASARFIRPPEEAVVVIAR
ncbi:MAG: insulinase family protein [Planctomycetes bacterium]|nr:insulinase family protein [Planctomycetota bacterium]